MEWEKADEVKEQLEHIVQKLNLEYIIPSRIFCFRSHGSKSRSYARIWSFPKIFQTALGIEPAYVIEVLAKYYDRLDSDQQTKVIIHELMHIPKNFSGSLLPHRGRNRHLGSIVNKLFKEYQQLR